MAAYRLHLVVHVIAGFLLSFLRYLRSGDYVFAFVCSVFLFLSTNFDEFFERVRRVKKRLYFGVHPPAFSVIFFTTVLRDSAELVMGWVHPWVGLGWVGSEFFF